MEPQLLTVIEEEKLKTWPVSEWKNWQIEAKRDGFRMLVIAGKVESRSGKPLHHYEHILEELKAAGVKLDSLVLDGEFHGSSWEETSHVARASKSERAEKLTYTVFDVLLLDEWEKQHCPSPLTYRQNRMHVLLRETEHVKFVKPHEGHSYLDFSLLHQAHLHQGCDGTVLKRVDSLYEFKRTKTWLKVKPVLDCDCLVVGMKEGTGKYKGMLGALEVVPELPGFPKPPTTFVSGMDDLQREAWWAYRDTHIDIVGKWIEVSYRKVNPSGRLVEPRFVRVREDK